MEIIMLFKKLYVKACKLSNSSTTIVKFDDVYKFTVRLLESAEGKCKYQIENIHGNLKIVKITNQGTDDEIPFDSETKTFAVNAAFFHLEFEFFIETEEELKESSHVFASYQLNFQKHALQLLPVMEYYTHDIILTNYESLKLQCFIKKMTENKIDLFIPNLYEDAYIEGEKGDYHFEIKPDADLNKTISFVFDPKTALAEKEN